MPSSSRTSLVVKGLAVDEISTVKVFTLISMELIDAYMYAYMYQHGELCDHEIRVIYRGISTKLRVVVALYGIYRPAEFQPSPI